LPEIPWILFKGVQSSYYAEQGPGRLAFLNTILAQLQEESWQFHPDNGWKKSDVIVFGRRWTQVTLSTVTEHLGQGRQVLHCRLQPGLAAPTLWTLPAAGFVSIAVSTRLALEHPWWWTVWLILPALLTSILLEQRLVIRLLLAVVGVAAERLGLQEHLAAKKPAHAPQKASGPSAKRDELEELL
jgi:hypothetical protein